MTTTPDSTSGATPAAVPGVAGPAVPPVTSGATAPTTRVLAQARFEAGNLLRNGEQLLVSIILPAMVLIALHVTSSPSLGVGRRIDLATPGVFALCIISASFTGQAISTAFERRYAVLRYLGTTPLGRGGLLAAKAVATLAVEILQILVLGGLAVALGWRPQLGGLAYAAVFVLLGTWAFVSLALLIGGTLRAEGVLAVANLLWVLFLVAGGVIIPRAQLGGVWDAVLGWLPSAGLADGLRAALHEGTFATGAAGVLLVWGVVCSVIAARTFRWSD